MIRSLLLGFYHIKFVFWGIVYFCFLSALVPLLQIHFNLYDNHQYYYLHFEDGTATGTASPIFMFVCPICLFAVAVNKTSKIIKHAVVL